MPTRMRFHVVCMHEALSCIEPAHAQLPEYQIQPLISLNEPFDQL